MERTIGKIGNYYGHLSVKDEEGKYFWGIEDYNRTVWEEIPKTLYDELVRFGYSISMRSE
jgi:hypothetical protein